MTHSRATQIRRNTNMAGAGDPIIAEVSDTNFLPDDVTALAASAGVERRIEIIKGDATKTIKDCLRDNPAFRVTLLNLDFDVYLPPAAAPEYLYPAVVPGGLSLLDVCGGRGWGNRTPMSSLETSSSYITRFLGR